MQAFEVLPHQSRKTIFLWTRLYIQYIETGIGLLNFESTLLSRPTENSHQMQPNFVASYTSK